MGHIRTMPVSSLDEKHYIFGNKGNLWSGECHIQRYGESHTLCGITMLSNNWAQIQGVDTIGCLKCITIYTERHGKTNNS